MGTRLERLQETFGLDLRSLGLLRILIGAMLLVDYSVRAVDLRSHYTEAGVVPVAFQIQRQIVPYEGRFSFHLDSGDAQHQLILFGLSFLFALTLLVGYRTKLSLIACLVLMISVQNRNMEIETGGDYLLRLICMWALFLPLGARFSLDARAGRAQPDPSSRNYRGNQYFSVATVAVLVQMAIVYFFSALHKDHPIWRVHDTAIHYALHIDAYDTSLGEILRQFPMLTGAMTRLTLGYEFVAPWLIFSAGLLGLVPVLDRTFYPMQNSLRSLVSLSFVLFHLGLAMTLSLGTFAWFAALIWLGLFPTWAWDRLQDFRTGTIPPDPYPVEDERRGEEPSPPWVYKLRHPQLLRALDKVDAFFTSLETPPKGKKKRVRLPAVVVQGGSWLGDACAAVLLFYTVAWNLYTVEPAAYRSWLNGGPDTALPNARPALNFIRLDQHWGLFAPYPRTSDGYYVVLIRNKKGEEMDYLRDDLKVTWEKPADVSGSYSTFRWRKYFRNIRRRSKRRNLAFYSNYVCREWNAQHSGDEELDRVSVYFMRRQTLKKGGHSKPKKERLWTQSCHLANQPYGAPPRFPRPPSASPASR